MTRPVWQFQKLHPEVWLPRRATEGSAGLDVHAFLLHPDGRPWKLTLPPKTTKNVPTGLLVATDQPIFVLSRSGMAANSVFVANAPGLIDPDYRGELKILLYNGGFEPYYIHHEDRIAQLVPGTFAPTIVHETEIADNTTRGRRGFGSTGR